MKRDYIDFQDRSMPLAYFISFRCYGTWLHGDSRGSVDRRHFNRHGAPKFPVRPKMVVREKVNAKQEPVSLDRRQRRLVESALKQVCSHRGYGLIAVNVRSNHAHSVVSAASRPEPILTAFKAYATRHLRESGLIGPKAKVWSRHGSTRYLWTPEQIEAAADYVLYCQGDEFLDIRW